MLLSLLLIATLAACSTGAPVAEVLPIPTQRPAETPLQLVPGPTTGPTATAVPTATAAPTEAAPIATPLPLAPQPVATPDPTEEPEPEDLSVKVTKLTKTVARNGTASITIKTSKGAECSITVEYKSGPATAAGLGDKTANSDGLVTWKWKVGGRTTKGTWPIYVWCELGDRDGSVDTEFTVR